MASPVSDAGRPRLSLLLGLLPSVCVCVCVCVCVGALCRAPHCSPEALPSVASLASSDLIATVRGRKQRCRQGLGRAATHRGWTLGVRHVRCTDASGIGSARCGDRVGHNRCEIGLPGCPTHA
ncbi:hypothetical protein AAHA92_17188 [Salvia divinorum]|uniref:Secreted protein n=1 Tax=Salvia divinorum TaxID=28513 RepID=A0ABD1H0W9_SALDI